MLRKGHEMKQRGGIKEWRSVGVKESKGVKRLIDEMEEYGSRGGMSGLGREGDKDEVMKEKGMRK